MSEPQIAVELIFTIASRSFRIFGSGTFSTWTVLRPDQTFARISDPRLLDLGVIERLRGAHLQLALGGLALGHGLGAGDLTRLDLGLEAPQRVLRLGVRLAAGQLLRDLAELATGGLAHVHVDLGAAVARRVAERDGRIGAVEAVDALPEALDLLARAQHRDGCLRTHGES